MSQREWRAGLTISMDPDAVEDYEFDFTAWMDGENGMLATVTPQNCVASVVGSVVNNVVVVRVSEVAADASVVIHAESPSGRKSDFTTYFRPVQQ